MTLGQGTEQMKKLRLCVLFIYIYTIQL